jgi:hypothetical protein
MNENEKRLHEALAKIVKVANTAVSGIESPVDSNGADPVQGPTPQEGTLVCTPKTLPERLLVKAAETAVKINPVNAPMFGPLAKVATPLPLEPMHIAVLTSKYWGPTSRQLTVSFMENTAADLRARIISHMNAWATTMSISFVETQATGDIRISRGPGGYWSYLGTDVRLIPTNRPTMNLEGFTMTTAESEYKRVVRHETGHTLGFPHEHMRRELVARIDPEKAYAYFLQTQGWPRQTVDQQVLTPLDDRSIFSTPADETSIMCYQLPGSITRDGRPILGGTDINQWDYAFAGWIYPQRWRDLLPAQTQEEWEESEDVEVVTY